MEEQSCFSLLFDCADDHPSLPPNPLSVVIFGRGTPVVPYPNVRYPSLFPFSVSHLRFLPPCTPPSQTLCTTQAPNIPNRKLTHNLDPSLR